jgi:hypothetical protein
LDKEDQAIGKLDKELRDKMRPDLEVKLKALVESVKSAFGLSWETFFNCLSQLSFINVHQPPKTATMLEKVGGPASAVAMGVSQVGAMITEGVKSVLTDSGEPVNKDLVLTQIEVIGEEVNLKSEFTRLASGMLSKEGSSRLLVGLRQFQDLVKKFYKTKPAARDLRDKLDAYIEKMSERNRHIDYYNALVQELAEVKGEMKRLELQKTSLEGKTATAKSPELDAMTAFVSRLYESVKELCIHNIYHARRAYAFSGLQPYTCFLDVIGRSPGAITALQLEQAEPKLTSKLLVALVEAGGHPKAVPAGEDGESSLGVVVVLTEEAHKTFFEDLRSSGRAEFELEPATLASITPPATFAPTTAAWSGTERPEVARSLPNPFHGRCDVRLTKVRTWMIGMKVKPGENHTVKLVHLGQEQFCKPDDMLYPERTEPAHESDLRRRNSEYVVHKEQRIPFAYDPTGLGYDPAKVHPFTPGKLFGDVHGTTDGNIKLEQENGVSVPGQGTYTPIGPFGKWRLFVRKEDNTDLDLSKLAMIVIDFHGYFRTFSDD